MKIRFGFAILAVVVFGATGFARAWPKWLPEHVREIRFRNGIPGEQIRVVSDGGEVEKILAAFRRAKEVGKEATDLTWKSWEVCLDMLGERPENGRWLLNLSTGDCTFLDPLGQPVYRLTEEDRQMMKTYFQPKEKEASPSQQPTAGR
jgi:hypothetical protein